MSQTTEPPSLRHRKNHIPHDIVLSILGQLPVKSVMRLRFVSKSLYSSIASTDFISTHLNNNISNNINRDNACVIHVPTFYLSSNRPVCTVALDRTFDTTSKFGIPFDFPTPQVRIVGSCNGLLCLAQAEYGNVIYLWNPSIRKFKKLPNTCLGNTKFSSVQLGFAYHSENNDYKVVRIPISPSSTLEIEVYTLSSDSWRRVGISLGGNGIDYHFERSLLPTPLVSGALHWIAIIITNGEENTRDRKLMSFDVNSEKFRELALPHGSINGYTHETLLSSFKEKLAFITREEPGFHFSIWVMREYGVIDSWTKLFVVPYDNERIARCTAFTEYGSLLMLSFNHMSKKKFVLIDIETLQKKKKDLGVQITLYVATFMESLVLLDGANVVSY